MENNFNILYQNIEFEINHIENPKKTLTTMIDLLPELKSNIQIINVVFPIFIYFIT